MTQENFDIQAWQQQGQTALTGLQAARGVLITDLEDVDHKIEEIKEALGLSQEDQKVRRVRIRPAIFDILEKHLGEWMPMDVVVREVCAQLDGADALSVVSAIRRTIRAFDNVEEQDSQVRLVSSDAAPQPE